VTLTRANKEQSATAYSFVSSYQQVSLQQTTVVHFTMTKVTAHISQNPQHNAFTSIIKSWDRQAQN